MQQQDDEDMPRILLVYKLPSISRFISIDETNYWKLKDIQKGKLGVDFDKILVSIDENNIASLKLFENAVRQ